MLPDPPSGCFQELVAVLSWQDSYSRRQIEVLHENHSRRTFKAAARAHFIQKTDPGLSAENCNRLPAIGGAEAARASEAEAAHLRDIQSGAWVPADAMAFDKVVSPADLRNELIAVLQR